MITPDTVVVPPALVLEVAFPGDSVAMLRNQASKARRQTLQDVRNGVSIGGAIKRAWHELSLRYHPDKRRNVPGSAFSLINMQYRDLQSIFTKGMTSIDCHSMVDYYNKCLSSLRPDRVWGKVWKYLMTDEALDIQRCKEEEMMEEWIRDRTRACKDLMSPERIDPEALAACFSSGVPSKFKTIEDGPKYPVL